MGQAKNRGTFEDREAEAIIAANLKKASKEHAAAMREAEIARQWALLTPEEKEKRLEAAKRDAEAYGMLAGEFGHDVASFLLLGDSNLTR